MDFEECTLFGTSQFYFFFGYQNQNRENSLKLTRIKFAKLIKYVCVFLRNALNATTIHHIAVFLCVIQIYFVQQFRYNEMEWNTAA